MRNPRPHFLKAVAVPAALAIGAMLAVSGCGASKRPEMTDAQFREVSAADTAQSEATFRDAIGRLIARVEREEKTGAAPVIDILALSGGGDYGAFGAGFLIGWGSVQDPAFRRPQFDVVTGVSTGALLAPFAFVGDDKSLNTVEDFYRNPRADWVHDRGLLFFLPSNASFATIPGLERDIRGVMDAEFVANVADRSRDGALLLVSATDLELGRQKYWSVGAEAEKAQASGDESTMEDMMLASAAIPALFPPRQIGESVYADGGVSANVLLRLDPRNPAGFIQRWKSAHPDRKLPKVRYWVIINNQWSHQPKTVQLKWPSVISPSLATAIRSATLAEVRWLAAQADYVNVKYDADLEVRVVAIPDDWRPPVEGSFVKESMVSLADLGRQLGADPKSWKLWAAPE
jgi:hypothetical protein